MYPKKVKLQIEFSNHQDCLRSLRRPDGNFLNSEKQLCMARFKDNRFVITSLNCTIQCSPSAATTLYIASGDARIWQYVISWLRYRDPMTISCKSHTLLNQ